VFYSDKYHNEWPFVASRKMLDAAKVKYWQHIPAVKTITINFESINDSSTDIQKSQNYQQQKIQSSQELSKT
jgi:hypothetical protein